MPANSPPPLPPLCNHAGRGVMFVMAAEAEYGAALRARFTPLITGVGPVEGGVATADALARLAHGGRMPDLVVSLGSAGSARLEQGRVYQASHIAYRDMDASPLGFPVGQTPFLDQPPVITLEHRLDSLPQARLSTGGNVVSGAGYATIAEDMVDMETWAVLRACQRHALPLIALRGISDGAEDLRGIDDWTALLPVIDQRLAEAVDRVLAALGNGALGI